MSAHPFDLSGKVALITGANAGIGLGFAEAIARAGGDVVIWGRREERNQQAAAALAAHGGRVLSDSIDVADEAAQLRGFQRAVDEMGRLDCVIANAGYAGVAPIVDMKTERIGSISRVFARRLSMDVMTSSRGCPAAGPARARFAPETAATT